MDSAGVAARRTSFSVLAIAAHLAIACQPEPQRAPVVVRDSLGIEIVENHEPLWALLEGWRFDADPSLEIELGADSSRRNGPRITAGARLADGRIVLLDRSTYELRYHDGETGTPVGRAGGRGRGPGQFSPPGDLRIGAADTIYVWDEPWDGVVVFDGAGRHIRTERVGDGRRVQYLFAWPPPPPPLLTSPHSLVTAGTFPAADSVHSFVVVARLRFEFDRTDTLATFLMEPEPAFGDRVVIAAGPADEELYVGRVTSREFRRFVGTRLRRIVRASGDSATHPMYTTLFIDRAGCVWMRLHEQPAAGDGERWLVFDRGGRELGEMALPRGLTPLDIGGDYVLGVIRRTGGGESVVLHGLHRD